MKPEAKLMCFSPGGEKLAQAGKDGILRIWDTATGRMEQEYQPAGHLAEPPSCLKFSPIISTSSKATPGKNKASGKEPEQCPLLAIGTKGGNVLVYSPEKKSVLVTFKHAPPHTIVDLAWHSPIRLFSLAADDTLIEWNIKKGEKIIIWEVVSGSSMCVLNKMQLCLGKSKIHHVKLLRKKKAAMVTRGFTGHTSTITQLVPVPSSQESANYFLSASQDDRFVYAWNLNHKGDEASASFQVSEKVYGMAVAATGGQDDSTIALAITTHKGTLVYFTQHLNGNLQKSSIKCMGTLRITSVEKGDKKIPIPILGSFFVNDVERSVIIVYGNFTFLKFERINVKQLTGSLELMRSGAIGLMHVEKSLVPTVTPKVTQDTTLLGPGHLMESQVIQGETSKTKSDASKRKRGDEDGQKSLPMEERLNALAIDSTTTATRSSAQPLKADNQVHLLLQGLHSKDSRLLQPVLSCTDATVINNTVQRLPAQAVVPLLRHLHAVIMGKGLKHCSSVQWVRSILYHHMGHLSSLPNRESLLSPFYTLATGRMATLHQMLQLHSRLDLMLTHVATRHQEAQQQHQDHQPLLLYQEESSSEEELGETMLGVSESEDNWEELSDFGAGDQNGHTDDSDMDLGHTSTGKRKMEDSEELIEVDSEEDEEDSEMETKADTSSRSISNTCKKKGKEVVEEVENEEEEEVKVNHVEEEEEEEEDEGNNDEDDESEDEA